MPGVIERPPYTAVEPVTDVLHGVSVTDPYRWLEDQNSPQTRAWIAQQSRYARSYLDALPGRTKIRERVRELLDVETYDSFIKYGNRYFFRKRLRGQEQPSIYFREGATGEDRLLVDPAARGEGEYTAVKPLLISPDGSLLLYAIKHGGERQGTFEILNISNRRVLADSLPHGYLRGFAFGLDGKSFYYVHEASQSEKPFYRAAFRHVLGTNLGADKEVFVAGEDQKLRLVLVPGTSMMGFLVFRFLDKTYADFYLWRMESANPAIPILRNADYSFAPRLVPGRIIALTDAGAPNRRIVEVQPRKDRNPLYFDLVPETDVPIRKWLLARNHILVSRVRGTRTQITVFDLFGKPLAEIPCGELDTVRMIASSPDDDEVLLERESFTQPIEIVRCSTRTGEMSTWARRSVPFESADYGQTAVNFPSKNVTSIPMFLSARKDVLERGIHPAIMTAYGGYGIPVTPQFSVFVGLLLERGCLFGVPNIRGGSEYGREWHDAAKRRKRQTAFDDFLSAAEWLIETGRTEARRLAIFGASNSGLLVGAALTQRPDLFRAVLCMVPLLDMLRYQHFDAAHVQKDEFGTTDDLDDFRALASYSPYHAVRQGRRYPATLFVSGDADQNCNPLHARKMTARLQAANTDGSPVVLDYAPHRGHSPTLPLSDRIDALTDRIAFFCDELGLTA